jgi:putative heme transporter
MAGRVGHRKPSNRAPLRLLGTVVCLALTIGVLSRIAGRRDLVVIVGTISLHHRLLLASTAALNLLTYWIVLAVALPGLGVRRAATVHLPSTALSNSLPAGGALGTGLSFTILRRHGYRTDEAVAAAATVAVWNTLLKAAATAAAFGVLATRGSVDHRVRTVLTAGLVTTTVVVAVVVVALLPTRRASKVADRLQAMLRPGASDDARPWSAVLDGLRAEMRRSARHNGLRLTVAMVCSHAALSAVFVVAVRAVGIDPSVAPAPTVLALFALSRTASLVPSTPGGIGVVELTLTALLSTSGAGGSQVVAAVLLYRAATYLLPTILGGIALIGWTIASGSTLLRPAVAGAPSTVPGHDMDVPLVVDLDGTFFPVTTRTLMATRLLLTRPSSWCAYRRLCRTDRAASKRHLCELVHLDVRRVPVRRSLLQWLEAERARGRQLFVASGAPQPIVDAVVANYASLFSQGWGSSADECLVGPAKAALLCRRFGVHGFDYIGDAAEDLAVWERSRRAVLCCTSRRVGRRARRCTTVCRVFPRAPGRTLGLGLRTACAALRGGPPTIHPAIAPQARVG